MGILGCKEALLGLRIDIWYHFLFVPGFCPAGFELGLSISKRFVGEGARDSVLRALLLDLFFSSLATETIPRPTLTCVAPRTDASAEGAGTYWP